MYSDINVQGLIFELNGLKFVQVYNDYQNGIISLSVMISDILVSFGIYDCVGFYMYVDNFGFVIYFLGFVDSIVVGYFMLIYWINNF